MANAPKNEIFSQKRWAGGIGDYPKETANGQIADGYYFGRAVNYRDDPQSITLLPASLKKSGGNVTDLVKWADRVPVTLTTFLYGNTGNFYQRTNAGSYSNLHTVSASHGNGLGYFTGDDYIYYAGDSVLGRYGPTQGTPTFSDNFLKAQGGVPQNTASILLASASSMYATAADSASLEITGDLTLETYFKANTLPTTGNAMTFVGKWDESTNHRGYKLDLFGVSGFFGNGTDGSLTISSNTIEAPIDSACTGTAGTQALTATNASFAAGQVILIHQTQGTNAGQWERNTIQGYTAGTITLGTALMGTYTSGAQVRVLKQYTSVTINSGITWTAKAWNGTVGGILSFLANGTVTVTGNISANGTGFRGGAGANGTQGTQGEGNTSVGIGSTSANTQGGGGGNGDTGNRAGGGGGGGYGLTGTAAVNAGAGVGGLGGLTAGSSDLTTMLLGGGGGGGARGSGVVGTGGNGGAGGGIIFVNAVTLTITGTVVSTGANGQNGSADEGSGGGAGAGGSILMKVQTATLGTTLVTAGGGTGGSPASGNETAGGSGGTGRIVLDYLTSYTGTTTPTLNAIQDNTLVTTTTIQARLGISNDGTAFEYLTMNLNTLAVSVWNRLSVSWKASTSTATFYLNAVSLGTSVGTKTSISSNASLLYVGANKTSVVANFFDGLLNDMRIWSNVQTAGQIYANNQIQINAASTGLGAYYKFNSAATDATSNANNLTLVNSPTYSVDVPFPAPTTRLDIDQQNTNTGQLYTLLTSISESAADLLSFKPAVDPQSSMAFYVDTKGTGNWTLTIHDKQNNVIATQTILAANVPTSGIIEFVFSAQWNILLGSTYHAHLTVSTGTSKVVTGTISDFSTAEYTTYFGFLATDTQFHPIVQFQYQPLGGVLTGAEIIGNGRYLAVWDGANYSPNFITFPPAWRVRCFGFWREFLAIGMWRGGKITDFTQGKIYFWDGVSPTFNFSIDVPDGQINALFGVDTDLYIIAGYRGILLDYQGTFIQDTGNGQGIKVKRVPLIQPADTIEVFPGAFTMWRSLLHIGVGANMSSSTIQQGVYAHGTFNKFYPDTMSYDYQISTGNTGSTVNIGLVYPVGDTLLVGWQDGIGFGIDEVNFSNNPASSGELQTFIMDDGKIWKQKENFSVRADYLALRSGESVAPEISIDRAAFTVGTADATVGDTYTHLPFAGGRGKEYQIGVKLFATGSTSPTLTGLSLLKDKSENEGQF